MDGTCIVHDAFKGHVLRALKDQNPDAVLAHPESPAPVLELADVIGSTSQLINAAKELPNQKLIVATDNGIFYKMKQAAPKKVFLEAPTVGQGATCESCAHCPWVAMNDLRNLAEVLESGNNEIHVEESVRSKAYIATMKMLDFARTANVTKEEKTRRLLRHPEPLTRNDGIKSSLF